MLPTLPRCVCQGTPTFVRWRCRKRRQQWAQAWNRRRKRKMEHLWPQPSSRKGSVGGHRGPLSWKRKSPSPRMGREIPH